MFRSNKVEPTILEEDGMGSVEVSGKVVPFESSDSKIDEVEALPPIAVPSSSSIASGNAITPKSIDSFQSSRKTSLTVPGGRRSSSVAFIMERMQSKLKKTVSLYARKQLFQTQKFFTPFKRWLFNFYDHKFEPQIDLALSDLKDNRSGAWVMHPQSMCCVHIIQVQLAIYRKASFWRVLETYLLTGLPMWGTFLFQGCILYNLWMFMRESTVSSTGFCTNSFLLELSTLVVYIMFTVVDNTERFEANALVAISPLYGRLPNVKKFDLEAGEVKPGMHNLIMKRHFGEFMRSNTPIGFKILYLFALCSIVFDVWIFIAITYIGSKYIATSNGVSNVIQSAVALTFIWSLGDVVFNQTYSDSIVEDLQSIHILVPTNDSDWDNVEGPKAANTVPPFMGNLGSASASMHHFNQGSSVTGGTVSAGSSVNGEDECLDEHILFLNNNVIYNAFFVLCLLVIPIFVAGMLIYTRIHYCGEFKL